jgi:Winged helix DNA-binding domain
MPRAALFSIHARVKAAGSAIWEHPSLLQIWGPRFSNYVVAADDLPIFSLGRLPENARGRERAYETAARLHKFLQGRRMPFGQAGRGMGVQHNSLRYATATGTVLMRWDGARQPIIWTVPKSGIDPGDARLELVRRYLHIFGPATASSFAKWAGISTAEAHKAFADLSSELTQVRTPVAEAFILTSDESTFRGKPKPAAPVRLLPSGDAYYLYWGADRQLLVPDAKQRAALWTTRVWPGALLVRGEIAGVWRRAAAEVSIEAWRRLSSAEREIFEAEAKSMPVPGIDGAIAVSFRS